LAHKQHGKQKLGHGGWGAAKAGLQWKHLTENFHKLLKLLKPNPFTSAFPMPPQTADHVTQAVIVPQQPSLPPTALRTSPNPRVEGQRRGRSAPVPPTTGPADGHLCR